VKEIQGPYIAWYQEHDRRALVEIAGAPFWTVEMPYLKNWRRPMWVVDVFDLPDPRGYVVNGQKQMDVRFLYPMNADTRALLALRDGKPVSPYITPEVPEIVFPDAEVVRPDLVDFVERLFYEEWGNQLERIELRQALGPAWRKYATVVMKRDFKNHATKPSREQCVQMAVELVTLAQRDCDSLGKSQHYGVLAAESGKYYACFLLSMTPSRVKDAP
jgi:hypothetical protein